MFGLSINLQKRYPGLDLARTIAISLVVFAHSLWISTNYPPIVSWLMQFSGTIGVEIFFVISGFLIGRIIYKLIHKENFALNDVFVFLKRRWFRTLPNYYLILIINAIMWWFFYNEVPENIFLYFFYLQNFTSTSPDFFRISWSLAVEQFSYITAPFFLLVMIKIMPKVNKSHLFLILSLFMIILFVVIRITYNNQVHFENLYEWNEKLRKVTIYRLDAIFYGFLTFYLFEKGYLKRYKNSFFLVGILSILLLQVGVFMLGFSIEKQPFFFNVLYLSFNLIAICMLLPFLIEVQFKNIFFLKCITLISVISYSIYLLHYTIILHFMKSYFPSEQLLGLNLLVYTLLYWLIVLFSSYFLYRFFEKPITELRDNS